MNQCGKIILISVIAFIVGMLSPLVFANVPVKSAGVGLEDRVDDTSYSLKLVFFEKSGAYIANMDVNIYDAKNQLVIHELSHGPWLYIDLPRGVYRVEATRQDGQFQGASFTITDKQTEIGLAFSEFQQ